MEPDLLLETSEWLAVNKPAGVVVIPARREDPERSLWRSLERARGERLWVVHRIDRDTSGVVLLARTAAAHRFASIAFQERTVRKRYLGWTRGAPAEPEGLIRTPLRAARRGKMQPAAPEDPGARPAETRFRIERRWRLPAGDAARVALEPLTGRQHQIRVHLRSIGAPLLIDPLYGARETGPGLGIGSGLGRLTLHAHALEMPAAVGEAVAIEAPIPPELAALEAELDAAERAEPGLT